MGDWNLVMELCGFRSNEVRGLQSEFEGEEVMEILLWRLERLGVVYD